MGAHLFYFSFLLLLERVYTRTRASAVTNAVFSWRPATRQLNRRGRGVPRAPTTRRPTTLGGFGKGVWRRQSRVLGSRGTGRRPGHRGVPAAPLRGQTARLPRAPRRWACHRPRGRPPWRTWQRRPRCCWGPLRGPPAAAAAVVGAHLPPLRRPLHRPPAAAASCP